MNHIGKYYMVILIIMMKISYNNSYYENNNDPGINYRINVINNSISLEIPSY